MNTEARHPTYLELLCRMAGVTMEALAEADASVRGLPAPFDGLRVTLEMDLFFRGHPDTVFVDPKGHKPMRNVAYVWIQATGPKLKRGTDRDIVKIKRGALGTNIPAGCADPFPAAFHDYANRLERLLGYYLEDYGDKAEPGLAEAVAVTATRLRELAAARGANGGGTVHIPVHVSPSVELESIPLHLPAAGEVQS